MFSIILAVAIGIVLAGMTYQHAGSRRDSRRFPAPGQLVPIAAHSLHLHKQGSGSPTVILESGIAASSLSWRLIQSEVAKFTQVCSYDRAGLGWSNATRDPRTLARMVEELHALLSRADIAPPYILVGHSFGGLIVRAFAAAHRGEVAGLVLLDPVSVEHWSNCDAAELKRLRLGVLLSRRGAFLARLGIVRASLAMLLSGSRFVPKLIAKASASRGAGVVEKLTGEVSKLPREVWPMIQAHWSRPECFSSMAAYLESLPENARASTGLHVPKHIPLIVISAENATGAELRERDLWVRESSCGKSLIARKSGHWIQLDEPELVIATIRELTL